MQNINISFAQFLNSSLCGFCFFLFGNAPKSKIETTVQPYPYPACKFLTKTNCSSFEFQLPPN